MDHAASYFLVGMVVCFIGTLPFGPINLTVVKTTVDHDRARGLEIAVAASLIEIVEALIAISFGMLISNFLDSNAAIKLLIGVAFIGLAVYVYSRDTNPSLADRSQDQRSFFMRGLVLAAINPQAIPFWIIAIATISQNFEFVYAGFNLISFLIGVFLGKLLALFLFVIISEYLKTHLKQSSKLVNRALSSILLLIGLSQIINAS